LTVRDGYKIKYAEKIVDDLDNLYARRTIRKQLKIAFDDGASY